MKLDNDDLAWLPVVIKKTPPELEDVWSMLLEIIQRRPLMNVMESLDYMDSLAMQSREHYAIEYMEKLLGYYHLRSFPVLRHFDPKI